MKVSFQLLAATSLGVAALMLASCQTSPKPAWEVPPGVKTMAVHGYPIAYAERGTGPTVVLVHGSLNDYRYWTPQLESLSANYRIVSLSLRHYYPEPWAGVGEFSFARHAHDLAAFIEGLNVGPVHLVGWSRGGVVAVDMARGRADLVKKLVLMDPALDALVPGPNATAADDERIKRIKAAEAHFRKGEMEAGLQHFFDSSNSAGAWGRLAEQQRQNRRDNAWTIVGQLADVETTTCAHIASLKMPVLLLGGEHSPARYNRIRAALQKCLPSAVSVTIPKAAHQMNQMNPAAFDAALAAFLSD